MIIDITICISLLICIIGFIFVTSEYLKQRKIYNIYYKEIKAKEKEEKRKQKERDKYYGIFH